MMNNEDAIRNLFPGMKTLKTEMESVKKRIVYTDAGSERFTARRGRIGE